MLARRVLPVVVLIFVGQLSLVRSVPADVVAVVTAVRGGAGGLAATTVTSSSVRFKPVSSGQIDRTVKVAHDGDETERDTGENRVE